VRVRPKDAPEPPHVKQARMTSVGVAALRELADHLEPSPLQAALARMAARHGRNRRVEARRRGACRQ
jgi:hypothetical protein